MKEFQYTTDSLAEEIIGRLKNAATAQRRAASDGNSRAEMVRQMEADRGGDGDRPDPNSLEAIVDDCASKIRHMESRGGGSEVGEALMEKISSTNALPADIRTRFVDLLSPKLAPE